MGLHLRKEIYGSGPGACGKPGRYDESKLPGFWTIVGIILIPLVLIILDSVAGVVPAMESLRPIVASWVSPLWPF